MMEVFGGESSGKTALILQFIAAVQRFHPDAIANLVEPEQSFEADRAEDFGCDTDRLLLSQPYTREDTRDIIIDSLKNLPDNGPPSILVWDSVDSGPPEGEMDVVDGEKNQPGVTAKLNSFICRNAIPLAARKQCILVFVNQVRSKIGISFGDPDTTPGGRAIPFYAAVRMQLWGAKQIKSGDNAIGRLVTVKAIKNKVAPPYRKARLKLDFGLGWDNDYSTLTRAKILGLIEKQAKGREAVVEARAKLMECKWGLTLALPEEVDEAPVDEDGYDAAAPHPDDLTTEKE
jgi:recombination protein RecA